MLREIHSLGYLLYFGQLFKCPSLRLFISCIAIVNNGSFVMFRRLEITMKHLITAFYWSFHLVIILQCASHCFASINTLISLGLYNLNLFSEVHRSRPIHFTCEHMIDRSPGHALWSHITPCNHIRIGGRAIILKDCEIITVTIVVVTNSKSPILIPAEPCLSLVPYGWHFRLNYRTSCPPHNNTIVLFSLFYPPKIALNITYRRCKSITQNVLPDTNVWLQPQSRLKSATANKYWHRLYLFNHLVR